MIETIQVYIQSNPFIAVFAVFLGGLLSASSPCVLAVMPLAIGYVGSSSKGNKKKAVQLSLLFVLGLSLTFTALGAIAGLFGRLFGDVGQWWYWFVATVIIMMGLSMMGVFQFRLPFAAKLKTEKKGALGAFLLGLLFGVVSTPCATPVLILILTFVADQKEVMYGVFLLFVYSIGHCALLFVAGISAGFFESYIQNKGLAKFSEIFKKILGGLVIFAGLYILYTKL